MPSSPRPTEFCYALQALPPAGLLSRIFLGMLLATLIACSSAPAARREPLETSRPAQQSNLIEAQLTLASQSRSPAREDHLLNAIELLLLENRLDEADALFNQLDRQQLPQSQALRYGILYAEATLSQGEADEALAVLQAVLPQTAPDQDVYLQLRALELRARAHYNRGDYVAAINDYIAMTPLLNEQERVANNDAIWQILSSMPPDALTITSGQVNSYELRGWLELVQVVNANANDMTRQIEAVNAWRNKWVEHSAARELPESLLFAHELWRNRAEHVALLLPLSEPAGRAVNEGFLAAYYDALDSGLMVPQIRVYDTAGSNDVMPLYQRAVEDGAQMIIGPLRKDFVRQLQSQRQLPVPTLALNYGDLDLPSPEQLYQFGLAPEDEIMQAADMAWASGHRNAAVLLPSGEQYLRIRDSFIGYWQSLGGTVVAEVNFSNAQPYSDVVRQLLSIEASEARANQLRGILSRNTIHFTPRRRQDVDFIFLLASPVEGRQIRPTLTFHFAGDIPVYAMPGIYDGGANQVANRDLNGVIFTDAPWVLRGDPLRDTMATVLPRAGSDVQRLRAMGVDTFRLYARIEQLRNFPAMRLQGATGTLSMGPNGNIRRELLEARFEEGTATLITNRPRTATSALAPLRER